MTAIAASGTHVPLHEDPEIQRRRWFLLGVMCLSLVLVVMSVSGLNVALPSIQQGLDATASQLQWIVDAYAVVFAGLLLTAGALGDRFGRRRALVTGLLVFAAGAFVGGFATSATQVVVGRAIQGIGAAFVMPATLSLISSIFPPHERRQAIAIWAGFAGAGGALGPVVSGALLEQYWWGSAFLVNVPVVALTLAAVVRFAPTSKDESGAPLDPVGALLSLVGFSVLVFSIIEGPERGWDSGLVLGGFAVALLTLAAFVAWERRSAHPMLPLHYFRDRRFSVGSAVITLAFFAMFGFFFLVFQYLQFVKQYSPLQAGLGGLPLAFAMIAVAPRSAALADRFGTGPVVTAGFGFVALGFSILVGITPGTSFPVLGLAFALLGAGMSLTVAPSTDAIMRAVPPDKAGVGSAVNDTARELGGALGIAVLGSLATSVYRASIDVDGLGVDAELAEIAGESVGAATVLASRLPGGGVDLLDRAGAAFTDAFNTVSTVSVAVALVAAALVLATFGRRAEAAADGEVLEADGVVELALAGAAGTE